MKPHQIISLMTYPGADNTLAMADHYNHIHVGFRPLFAQSASLAGSLSSSITPGQWIKLIARLGEIPDPTVVQRPVGGGDPRPRGDRLGRGQVAMATTTPQAARGAASGQPPPRPVGPSRGRYRAPARGRLAGDRRAGRSCTSSSPAAAARRTSSNSHEGDQLVRGDQVQVGGVPVGSVKDIELTHDFKAIVTISVDSSLAPLHAGTTAQVRVPSLSSVANRYVALSPGPNNAPALSVGRDAAGERDQRRDRPRPAVQHAQPEDAQGPAAVHPGHRRTVRRPRQAAAGSDRILRSVAVGDRPLLRRARARSVDVHELPRRNGQGRDDDRRAQGTALRASSKTPTRRSRRSAPSRRTSPRG